MHKIIEFKNVGISLSGIEIIKNLSFQLAEGSIYCLIGESGSGKTTLLRLLNGLLKPDSGQVYLQNEEFDYSHAYQTRRKMGYALQGSGLFPHMNVFENLTIIARRSGWSANDLKDRSCEVLEMVNLDPDEFFEKYPHQMSGGEKQRVGIARSLFCRPQIMLMDEPFGALDPITREEVQELFIRLQEKYNLTVVIVTHDLAEAFKMADKIILLNAGRVEQIGRPIDLLNRPASEFATNFVSSNSPGNVLKSIKMDSVIETNYWVKIGGAKTQLVHLEDGKKIDVHNKDDIWRVLSENNQKFCFEVDDHSQLISICSKDSDEDLIEQIRKMHVDDNILNGVKVLLDQKVKIIPILNSKDEFIGCFNERAIKSL